MKNAIRNASRNAIVVLLTTLLLTACTPEFVSPGSPDDTASGAMEGSTRPCELYELYEKTGVETLTNGGNTKVVSYRAYAMQDPEAEPWHPEPFAFMLEVVYTFEGRVAQDASLTIDIDGETSVFQKVSSGTTLTLKKTFPDGWHPCREVNFNIFQRGKGKSIEIEEVFELPRPEAMGWW